MKVRVYYEDTDAGGIVYHTNFIKFCERARSEIFFSRNMMPHEKYKSGFVVRKIDADFFAVSRLGDLLEVFTTIKERRNTSLILRQEIYRENTILFGMDIVLVYIEEGKPKRFPNDYIKVFEETQKKSQE